MLGGGARVLGLAPGGGFQEMPGQPPARDGLGAGPLGLGAGPAMDPGTLLSGMGEPSARPEGPFVGGGFAGGMNDAGETGGEAGGKQGPAGFLGNISQALDLSSPSGQALFTTAMGLMSGEGKNFLDVAGRAGAGGLGVFSQAKQSQELSELRAQQRKDQRADELWRRQVQAADFQLRKDELGHRDEREEVLDERYWAEFERQTGRDRESDTRYWVEFERQTGRDRQSDERWGIEQDRVRARDAVGDERYWAEWERQTGRDRESDERWQAEFKRMTGRDLATDRREAAAERARRMQARQQRSEERRRIEEHGDRGEINKLTIDRAKKLAADEEQITPHDRNVEKKRLERMIPLIDDPTQKNDAELLYADVVNKTPMTVGELRKRRAQASARSVQRVQPGVAGGSHEALVGGGGAPPSSIPSHARGTAPAGSGTPNVTGDDLKARREARSAQ